MLGATLGAAAGGDRPMKLLALFLSLCLGLCATGTMAALKLGDGAPDFTVQRNPFAS